jgi:hypothetical protein
VCHRGLTYGVDGSCATLQIPVLVHSHGHGHSKISATSARRDMHMDPAQPGSVEEIANRLFGRAREGDGWNWQVFLAREICVHETASTIVVNEK